MRLRSTAAALAALLAVACDGRGSGLDAGVGDAGGVDPGPARVDWGTCPDGWSPRDVGGARACVPPERRACTGAAFQRVGGVGCEPVDDGCGAGRFRAVLPADRAFVYVDASATGGDGTEAHPFTSIGEALTPAASPVGIALAPGEYTISAALPADVAIVGTCAETVRLVAPVGGAAVLVAAGARAHVEGVTLGGEGFGLASRGDVTARAIVVEGALSVGIGILGGSLALEHALVRATRVASDGRFGRGISLAMGAHATLRDVVVEDSHDAGLSVEGATLEGDDVVVSDSAPNDLGRFGSGVSGFDGANITLRTSLVTRSANIGVEGDGSMLVLDRVVVSGGTDGLGVLVTNGPAMLARVWVDDAAGSGVAATGTTVLTASDLVVSGTRLRAGSGGGVGATEGAHLALSRALVEGTHGSGVVILGATLEATDLTVLRVEARDLGQALLVGQGGAAMVARFRFEHAQAVAVMASGSGTHATLSDGVVAHVDPGATFDVGRGVEADVGASVALSRVRVSDVVELGILAYGDGAAATTVSLTDVRVDGIHERACARSSCTTEGGGTGVAAIGGGAVLAERLEIDGAPLCGVQVAEGGMLDVTSGTIARSAIGACIQIDGYDLARIVAGVAFVDDMRNAETVSVYVPPRAPTP